MTPLHVSQCEALSHVTKPSGPLNLSLPDHKLRRSQGAPEPQSYKLLCIRGRLGMRFHIGQIKPLYIHVNRNFKRPCLTAPCFKTSPPDHSLRRSQGPLQLPVVQVVAHSRLSKSIELAVDLAQSAAVRVRRDFGGCHIEIGQRTAQTVAWHVQRQIYPDCSILQWMPRQTRSSTP
jgi:hypothetical protein